MPEPESGQEFGSLLLSLLSVAGWTVTITPCLIGEGASGQLEFVARQGPCEVRRRAGSVDEIAQDLFVEAMEREGRGHRAAA